MELISWLGGLFEKEAKTFTRIEWTDAGAPAAAADQHYFRIVLAQMFLHRQERFFQTWYPAVHSTVTCTFGDEAVQIPNVADVSRLLENQGGAGDIVARNFTLLPLMPFKGGSVRIVAGLFGVNRRVVLAHSVGGGADDRLRGDGIHGGPA